MSVTLIDVLQKYVNKVVSHFIYDFPSFFLSDIGNLDVHIFTRTYKCTHTRTHTHTHAHTHNTTITISATFFSSFSAHLFVNNCVVPLMMKSKTSAIQ